MEVSREVVALLIVAFFAVATFTVGWRNAIPATLILCLGGFSFSIISLIDTSVIHYGIAAPGPSLSIVSVLVLALLMSRKYSPSVRATRRFALTFGVLLLFAILVIWGGSSEKWAGVILLFVGILCVICGRLIAQDYDARLEGAIAAAAFIVILSHTLAAAGQLVGTVVVFNDLKLANDSIISFHRMTGLYNHPSVLGKIVLFLLAFLLPMTTSTNRRTRLVAGTSIALGVVGTLLTVSRTNIIAIGIAMAVWFIFGRIGLGIGQRLRAILVLIFGLIISKDTVEARFASDSEGGDRPELLTTGLNQLGQHFWLGFGPNSYSTNVGRYDYLASIGYPVHNSFVHMGVEIGVPLAILFFVPLAIATLVSIKGLRSQGLTRARATAFMAILPGTLMMIWTGWGIIAESTLPLWCLAVGYLWGVPHSDSAPTFSRQTADRRGVAA